VIQAKGRRGEDESMLIYKAEDGARQCDQNKHGLQGRSNPRMPSDPCVRQLAAWAEGQQLAGRLRPTIIPTSAPTVEKYGYSGGKLA